MSTLNASTQSFYLTLISMIQSLAFGLLLTSLGPLTSMTMISFCQASSTFLVIVMTWHEYAVGAMLVSWDVDLVDSLIPFAFGAVQFWLITSLGDSSRLEIWFLALSLFALVSLLGFLNQYGKLRRHEDMRVVLGLLRPTGTIVCVVCTCVGCFAASYGVRVAGQTGVAARICAAAGLLTISGFAMRGFFLYPRVMKIVATR